MTCPNPLLIQWFLTWFAASSLLIAALSLKVLASVFAPRSDRRATRRQVRARAKARTLPHWVVIHSSVRGSPRGWQAREAENRAAIAAKAQTLYDKQERKEVAL